jgi:NTP pyrophosphatase (non-canonical NTP hydrolase)
MNINNLIKEAHEIAKSKGWHDEDRSFPELIALMHSELSETLEEYRNGSEYKDVYYSCKRTITCTNWPKCEKCEHTKPEGIPIELADCVIRIFDACGKFGIDLEKAIELKMNYNRSREYRHGNKRA